MEVAGGRAVRPFLDSVCLHGYDGYGSCLLASWCQSVSVKCIASDFEFYVRMTHDGQCMMACLEHELHRHHDKRDDGRQQFVVEDCSSFHYLLRQNFLKTFVTAWQREVKIDCYDGQAGIFSGQ